MERKQERDIFFVHTQNKHSIIYSCLENCLRVHLAINFNDRTKEKLSSIPASNKIDYETKTI